MLELSTDSLGDIKCWVSFRGGRAAYWYPRFNSGDVELRTDNCHSGLVELRTCTLVSLRGGRAAHWYTDCH